MSELTRPPARIPLVDPKTGLISREWYRFLDQTFQRLGGAQGQSITELTADLHDDAGIEEIKLELYRARDDGNQAPPPLPQIADDGQAPPLQPQITDDNQAPAGAFFIPASEDPAARLEALEAMVAELVKAINDIKQGGLL